MVLSRLSLLPDEKYCSASEISTQTHIPFESLAKVLQKLSKTPLLSVSKGSKGGYFLYKNELKTFSFLELLKVTEPELGLVRCLRNTKQVCSNEEMCSIKDPIKNLNAKVENFLAKMSLMDLLEINLVQKESHMEGVSL